MDILLIGGGGREHALAWKVGQSPQCGKLYIAPGNAGTAARGENVPADTLDIQDNQAVVDFAKEKNIDLVVVAPDNYLAQGMVDALVDAEIRAFGPTRSAARLEWSKAFAKDFMKRHGIPSATSQAFSVFEEAMHHVRNQEMPIVIKADGLALGKGVVVAQTIEEAETTLRLFMLDEALGESGKTVVLEEFLQGEEVSIHAFCDGTDAKLFPVSRDHKRIFDGNLGPNTGGMGVIAPVPGFGEDFLRDVKEKIVMPTIRGMAAEGNPFRGVLYPGLMITKDGPKVIEFNARFGDPETESYMRLLEGDIIEIMLACIEGKLESQHIEWSNNFAVTIMLASGGYPEKYEKGFPITGIAEAESDPSVVVFHAGTTLKEDRLVTAGGRVVAVTAVGKSLEEGRRGAYAAAGKINFQGKHFRTDIGA